MDGVIIWLQQTEEVLHSKGQGEIRTLAWVGHLTGNDLSEEMRVIKFYGNSAEACVGIAVYYLTKSGPSTIREIHSRKLDGKSYTPIT